MANKNYRRGAQKEYRVRQRLLTEGWDIVQRSAGSHSLVDVWAVRKSDRKILLVQVKGNISEAERKKIMAEWEWLCDSKGEDKKFDVEFVLED